MLNTSAVSTAEARYDQPARGSHEGKRIRRVCVYGGSGVCTDPTYRDVAVTLGQCLAQAKVGLVYGGGTDGLLGALARSVFEAGGEVTAVVTGAGAGRRKLDGLHRLVVVQDERSRRREMDDAADAVLVLPGGVETLWSFVKRLVEAPRGRETKPIVVFDIGGFWQPLLALIEHMESSTFMRPHVRNGYDVCRTIDDLLPALSIPLRRAPALKTVSLDACFNSATAARLAALPLHLVDQPSDDGFSVYEVQPG